MEENKVRQEGEAEFYARSLKLNPDDRYAYRNLKETYPNSDYAKQTWIEISEYKRYEFPSWSNENRLDKLMDNGTYVPVGENIDDYYPPDIDYPPNYSELKEEEEVIASARIQFDFTVSSGWLIHIATSAEYPEEVRRKARVLYFVKNYVIDNEKQNPPTFQREKPMRSFLEGERNDAYSQQGERINQPTQQQEIFTSQDENKPQQLPPTDAIPLSYTPPTTSSVGQEPNNLNFQEGQPLKQQQLPTGQSETGPPQTYSDWKEANDGPYSPPGIPTQADLAQQRAVKAFLQKFAQEYFKLNPTADDSLKECIRKARILQSKFADEQQGGIVDLQLAVQGYIDGLLSTFILRKSNENPDTLSDSDFCFLECMVARYQNSTNQSTIPVFVTKLQQQSTHKKENSRIDRLVMLAQPNTVNNYWNHYYGESPNVYWMNSPPDLSQNNNFSAAFHKEYQELRNAQAQKEPTPSKSSSELQEQKQNLPQQSDIEQLIKGMNVEQAATAAGGGDQDVVRGGFTDGPIKPFNLDMNRVADAVHKMLQEKADLEGREPSLTRQQWYNEKKDLKRRQNKTGVQVSLYFSLTNSKEFLIKNSLMNIDSITSKSSFKDFFNNQMMTYGALPIVIRLNDSVAPQNHVEVKQPSIENVLTQGYICLSRDGNQYFENRSTAHPDHTYFKIDKTKREQFAKSFEQRAEELKRQQTRRAQGKEAINKKDAMGQQIINWRKMRKLKLTAGLRTIASQLFAPLNYALSGSKRQKFLTEDNLYALLGVICYVNGIQIDSDPNQSNLVDYRDPSEEEKQTYDLVKVPAKHIVSVSKRQNANQKVTIWYPRKVPSLDKADPLQLGMYLDNHDAPRDLVECLNLYTILSYLKYNENDQDTYQTIYDLFMALASEIYDLRATRVTDISASH